MRSTRRRRLLPGLEPPQVAAWPLGCHSGRFTGTEIDVARCVVVSISLPENQLSGNHREISTALAGMLGSLPYLKRLVLRDNSLPAKLPATGYTQLDVLDLRGNQFDYPPPDMISSLCVSGELSCGGVGVSSCQAFGEGFVVRLDAPEECVDCRDGPLASVLALGGMFLVFLGGLFTYAYFINKANKEGKENPMKKWVSTVSIMVSHLQTTAIVAKLRLAWPQSFETAANFLIVDGLNLQAARPECLAAGAGDLPFFYVFSLIKVVVPLILILSVGVTRGALVFFWGLSSRPPTRERRENIIDKLEMLETVVFSMQLVPSWSSAYQLIKNMRASSAAEGTENLAKAGGAMAMLLLIFEVTYMAKYGYFVWMYQYQEQENERRQRARLSGTDDDTPAPASGPWGRLRGLHHQHSLASLGNELRQRGRDERLSGKKQRDAHRAADAWATATAKHLPVFTSPVPHHPAQRPSPPPSPPETTPSMRRSRLTARERFNALRSSCQSRRCSIAASLRSVATSRTAAPAAAPSLGPSAAGSTSCDTCQCENKSFSRSKAFSRGTTANSRRRSVVMENIKRRLSEVAVPPERMQVRLRFTTERFAKHARFPQPAI